MANFNLPTIASLFADVITLFKDRIDDVARQMRTDVAAPTNMPDKSIRWNVTNSNWEQFDLGMLQWDPLAALYGIDVNLLSGQSGPFYLDWDNFVNVPVGLPPAVHSHDFGFLPSSPEGVLQIFRGTTAEIGAFTGLIGEISVDKTKQTVVVHDGATAGGFPLATEAVVSANTASIALKAPIASPDLTGTPTTPTAAAGNKSSQIANTTFVDGEINGQQTIWAGSGALTPTETNGAAPVTQELSIQKILIAGLDFDASTQQHAQIYWQSPKGVDVSAGLICQAIWTNAPVASSGDVVWAFKARAVTNNDGIDASFGTNVTLVDSFIVAGDLHASEESGVVTPSNTWTPEDLIFIDVFRDAANASDTYAEDARLIGIRIHYTTLKIIDS